MKQTFKKILYGGDYNPNQWPREIWDEDMRMFQKAGINSATINVFSWAKIQPSEEVYNFSELNQIVSMLCRENYNIVFGTSTSALPAWMVKRYPEVARTDYEGRHHKFGQRHNACPNSPVYQKYVKELVTRLVKHYGDNEHVTCWHVNNEYGGECYCENCEKAFRVWLRKKYGTLANLNKAWNLEFWGHTVYSWDEIVLPNALSEGLEDDRTAFAGISIDYHRFMSDSMLENYKLERDTIKQYQPEALVTTNMMGTYKGLDYFKWAKEVDIVSWDNYPSYNTPWSYNAMCHDLMRGVKKMPFMLMEQTPSQQNWQPYNSLKKPGQMRAQSYQAMAHGADTIQFFQLRRSVGGCEKFHGAVIEHAGHENTRVFREVAQLGNELKKLNGYIPGSVKEAKVGIIFDWDNYWALEYTSGPHKDLKYVEQIHQYYEYFYKKNIAVNIIPTDDNFEQYDLVIAPVLYMVKEGVADALEKFVRRGGTLVTGFMSGLVDQSDNVYLSGYPGPLRSLAGVWVEEIDALAPEQKNTVAFKDGMKAGCRMLCDIIHLESAEMIAEYTSDFYSGTPSVTRNPFGEGQTYYIGTVCDEEALSKILNMAVTDAKISPVIDTETQLEITYRETDTGRLHFVINFKDEPQELPPQFAGERDLINDEVLKEGLQLKKYDVKIIFIKFA